MYAYKQQVIKRDLQVVPNKHKVQRVQTKKVVKKKINLFVYLVHLLITIILFALFTCFIFPKNFHNIVGRVFAPNKIKLTIQHPQTMAQINYQKPADIDLYNYLNPIVKYVNNDLFMNRLLLTPTIQKMHSEVTTMYHTHELAALKKDLQNLMNQYPQIEPAIYAWEYENGRYIEINADKIYPAASIIKIPVLVRMFKSIEANQMTVYDEMTLTDYYKSSGSGSLQYAQSNRKYTLDQLAKTMIEDSDNTATNMLMSKMGGMDDINIGLREWGISKTFVRTWLPDLNGTNKTTANDIAKILYNLDNPGFLNINSREYIIDYMSHVKNDRLIAAGLGEGALFVHKTGDIGSMLGDAGIVYAQNGKKYIVVILANRPYNAPQGKEFIVKASNLIYKAIVE